MDVMSSGLQFGTWCSCKMRLKRACKGPGVGCKMHDRFCQRIWGKHKEDHKLFTSLKRFLFSQDCVGKVNVKNALNASGFGWIWLLTTNNLYIFVLELQIDSFWAIKFGSKINLDRPFPLGFEVHVHPNSPSSLFNCPQEIQPQISK